MHPDPVACVTATEAEFLRELAEIEAESIGWQPLEPGVYLHVSDDHATEVLVVGVPPGWGSGFQKSTKGWGGVAFAEQVKAAGKAHGGRGACCHV